MGNDLVSNELLPFIWIILIDHIDHWLKSAWDITQITAFDIVFVCKWFNGCPCKSWNFVNLFLSWLAWKLNKNKMIICAKFISELAWKLKRMPNVTARAVQRDFWQWQCKRTILIIYYLLTEVKRSFFFGFIFFVTLVTTS